MGTKYTLGVFTGNPNGNDADAEARFESQFQSFVTAMGGATPVTMNAFTDFRGAPSTWAGNAGWTAWSWSRSPVVGTAIVPVIGIPMSDNQHWADGPAGSTNVDFFRAITAGQFDADYKGIVDSWVGAGFMTLNLRLGYEMNGAFMPWYMGNDPASQSAWTDAFRHLSVLMKSEAARVGATANIVWNPTDINWTNQPTAATYPGDQYVDIVSVDAYSPTYPLDLYDWHRNDGSSAASLAEWAADPVNRTHFWTYPGANQWNQTGTGVGFGIREAAALAAAHGKQLAVSETGSGNNGSTTGPVDDPAFPIWLAGELARAEAQGVSIAYVNIWDSAEQDGDWSFANKPQATAAWRQFFGAGSDNPAAGPGATPTPQPQPPATPIPAAEPAPEPRTTPAPETAAAPLTETRTAPATEIAAAPRSPGDVAFVDAATGRAGSAPLADPGTGSPSYLQGVYIWPGSGGAAISTTTANVFLKGGAGMDALQVASGQNVLDGGAGSNFLVGGAGVDTFFTDARGGAVVWSTLVNFQRGDMVTLWGFEPGNSTYAWDDAISGAAGAEGATLRARVAGSADVNASVTFAGMGVAEARTLTAATGVSGGQAYLMLF